MKFCLNNRQPSNYLKKADQIKIQYRDIKAAPDYFEQYPDKEFILPFPEGITEKDEQLLKDYHNIVSITCALSYYENVELIKNLGTPFYMGYPIESFSEARALIDLGAAYIRPSGSLFFMTSELKTLKVPMRYTPNRAWLSVIPRKNGVCGTWIRPEDLKMYDSIPNSVVEFENVDKDKESALFRIYAEEHEWPGDLNMIIENLNVGGLNRMIRSETSAIRLDCGQKCMMGYNCHVCPNTFNLMSKLVDNYKKE